MYILQVLNFFGFQDVDCIIENEVSAPTAITHARGREGTLDYLWHLYGLGER